LALEVNNHILVEMLPSGDLAARDAPDSISVAESHLIRLRPQPLKTYETFVSFL
jgi:hypothetical protein